jgi:hypothetical protein
LMRLSGEWRNDIAPPSEYGATTQADCAPPALFW